MDWLLIPTVAVGLCGTLSIRASRGLRRPVPVVAALLCYAAATVGLARLVLTMPVGVLYPLWAGLGSVTLLVIDWLVFKERLRWRHPVGMALILAGVVLLGQHA